ncbi:MAG: AEC family transporter [Defluviitaleaceae bacterium]|nr:AEC family transporter [Defluviitaleaceae bacterium]
MQAFTDTFAQNAMFISFVSSLTTLAVCIIAGYISRKAKILSDELNIGMSSVLVKVTLPCMVFVSMMRPFSRTLLMESLATLFITAAVYLSGFFIGMGLARLMGASDDEKRVWQFALVFANVGYMGFPIIQAVYGYEGLIYTTMANVTFNILAFSLGVYLFRKDTSGQVKANLKAIAFNPALIATYIGFLFFVTGWRLPEVVQDGVSLVGNMTVPLSMILVGSILAKSRLLTLVNDPRVLPVIFVRLLVIPLAAFFILRIFVHNQVMLGVIVILAAMPVAALTVIFAEQYRGNTVVASKLVAFSSILCLLSIPLISLLLQ